MPRVYDASTGRPGMNGHCDQHPPSSWRVFQRHCNHSAFNGYHRTPSAYSGLVCTECAHTWRTKAKYVDSTPDLTPAERQAWHRGEFYK